MDALVPGGLKPPGTKASKSAIASYLEGRSVDCGAAAA